MLDSYSLYVCKRIGLSMIGISLLVLLGGSVRAEERAKPNIFVLLADTLRADHLGVYGYGQDTSPAIDAFARKSLIFSHAYSTSNFTAPAVASIFTGLYPMTHTMNPPNKHPDQCKELPGLPAALETLAELLKRNGYATAAVTPNPWIKRDLGFAQGFETFKELYTARASDVNASAREILKSRKSGKPLFLYLHYMDPHAPYDPPKELRDKFRAEPGYEPAIAEVLRLYDGDIHYLDREIDGLLSYLKEQKLFDGSAIVFVGDHGEQFGERGQMRHGHQLFNEETWVPLIVKPPGRFEPDRIESTVSLIDLYPTLLGMAGIAVPEGTSGLSLLNSGALESRRGVLSEVNLELRQSAFVDRAGKRLLLGSGRDAPAAPGAPAQPPSAPADQLIGIYDSRAERIERRRIEDPELEEVLRSAMDASIAEALSSSRKPARSIREVDPETIERLRSLGYLR